MAKVYSSVSDSILFPRDQSYMGTLDPRLGDSFDNMHYQPNAVGNMLRLGEFSDQASTSYESHPPVSAYSTAPSAYFGAQNVPYETQKGNIGRPIRRQTPSGSPSPSISQAFDHSSTFSSASGASAQSAASSTDGSPYARATHVLPYEDKWSGHLHGLGIAPGIVSSESISHESFPPANFENDLMLEDSKFPNYVGECEKNFFPSIPSGEPFASSISSGLAPQDIVHAFGSRQLALETTTKTNNTTMDAIIEEANSEVQTALHLISPISAVSPVASPTIVTSGHQASSPVPRESSFRASSTPSSAASRLPSRAASPHSSEGHIFPGHSIICLHDVRAPRGPHQSPERCHAQSSRPISHHQTLYGQFQSPFFSQSSGRFVAPLESSCRFSLSSPFPACQESSCVFFRSSFSSHTNWPRKADSSDLCRSFSYPTIRHTCCSQQHHCILPRRCSRVPSSTIANFSATVSGCIRDIKSRLTPARVRQVPKRHYIALPPHRFLSAIPTKLGRTQILHCVESFAEFFGQPRIQQLWFR